MSHQKDFWVSPSTFAWAWEDCKRCWWLNMTARIKQPRAGLPPVVERVDRLTLDVLLGQPLHALGVPGTVRRANRMVRAMTQEIRGNLFTVGGLLDLEVELDSGGWAIYDVKMTTPKPETADRYRRQNAAYAYALAHPQSGDEPKKIVRTGLLCITPTRMLCPTNALRVSDASTGEIAHDGGGHDQHESALVFSWSVVEQAANEAAVEKDIALVRSTLDEMASLLAKETAPKPSETCPYCQHIRQRKRLADESKAREVAA